MGLDMYLDKIKKHPTIPPKEMIRIAKEIYDFERHSDKTVNTCCDTHTQFLIEDLKPYAYNYKLYSYLGEKTYLFKRLTEWRKSNAIHQWFVNNVQGGVDDCRLAHVSKKKLFELLDSCRLVLKNRDKANEILPTQNGFFFGSTDYDEWYFIDIEDTEKMLEEIINEIDWYNEDVFYSSSW